MDIHELVMTGVRGIAVYVLVLTVLRLTGKRTIGNFSAFDLLVALMLGEVVDEIIYGDVSFAQGTTAILVIAGMKSLTSLLAYWDHGMDRILEGEPTLIIENGKFQKKGMRAERMNEKEVLSALRLEGIDDPKEVRLAYVEPDGELSVIKQKWAEPAQKRDLKAS